jgi:hypothetical protein
MLNSYLTPLIAAKYGLRKCFLFGNTFCMFSTVCILIAYMIDDEMDRQ